MILQESSPCRSRDDTSRARGRSSAVTRGRGRRPDARRGYAATSIAQISQRSGSNPASIYRGLRQQGGLLAPSWSAPPTPSSRSSAAARRRRCRGSRLQADLRVGPEFLRLLLVLSPERRASGRSADGSRAARRPHQGGRRTSRGLRGRVRVSPTLPPACRVRSSRALHADVARTACFVASQIESDTPPTCRQALRRPSRSAVEVTGAADADASSGTSAVRRQPTTRRDGERMTAEAAAAALATKTLTGSEHPRATPARSPDSIRSSGPSRSSTTVCAAAGGDRRGRRAAGINAHEHASARGRPEMYLDGAGRGDREPLARADANRSRGVVHLCDSGLHSGYLEDSVARDVPAARHGDSPAGSTRPRQPSACPAAAARQRPVDVRQRLEPLRLARRRRGRGEGRRSCD